MIKDKTKADSKPQKPHGGARRGAGRKKGSSKYGEPTYPIRIPESLVDMVKSILKRHSSQQKQSQQLQPAHLSHPFLRPPAFKLNQARVMQPLIGDPLEIPLVSSKVSAGFPSPADDYVEGHLDLNQHLIAHPAATFYVRVTGESMINAGILPNDLLVVDKSLTAKPQDIVIAILDAELTVKRLTKTGSRYFLSPENPEYKPIECTDHVEIWGVVTGVIRRF